MAKAAEIEKEKPSYFNMFDEEIIDSEEEMVAGENNYIEIKCMRPEDMKDDDPVLALA